MRTSLFTRSFSERLGQQQWRRRRVSRGCVRDLVAELPSIEDGPGRRRAPDCRGEGLLVVALVDDELERLAIGSDEVVTFERKRRRRAIDQCFAQVASAVEVTVDHREPSEAGEECALLSRDASVAVRARSSLTRLVSPSAS